MKEKKKHYRELRKAKKEGHLSNPKSVCYTLKNINNHDNTHSRARQHF